jgi:hypothetical protein
MTRHFVGRTYPWRVAPQQSSLPFQFKTKFNSLNYIYNPAGRYVVCKQVREFIPPANITLIHLGYFPDHAALFISVL